MLVLPTKYRPDNLERFVRCYIATGASLPVFVILDNENVFQYQHIKLPDSFKKVSVPAGTRLGDIFNLMFRKFPDDDFYGMVADDVAPDTFRWDILLREACLPDKIAWGWDSIQNERLPVHPFIGGNLVRKLGFWAVPGIKHWYVDNAWKVIAEGLGIERYLPEVRMPHHHYSNGKAAKDRTYDEQPDPRADEIVFNMWKERDLPGILNRLRGR